MIVKAPEEKFPTAPEGTFPAVCVDEIDLGMVTTNFGGDENTRHMVRLVWQIDETDADGKHFLVRKDYTASLHEKAKLRGELKSWRGREFTFDELVGFDMEQVVGAPCMISVVHNTGRKGGTFANVGAVMKLPKGMQPMKAEGYVRVKDRKTEAQPVPANGMKSQPRNYQQPPEEQPPHFDGITDDDVPFNRRSPLAGASKDRYENLFQMRDRKGIERVLQTFGDGGWSSREMQGVRQSGRSKQLSRAA